MNFSAINSHSLVVWERFKRWIAITGSSRPLTYFGRAFAGIWLAYDLLDLTNSGTESFLLLQGRTDLLGQLKTTQFILIGLQGAWLLGFHPRMMALLAAAARAYETIFYSLNDFRYICVITLILAMSDADSGDLKAPARRWPRDLLMLQTAWIYFASAFLKLNPPFLSGGELYVRQNYLLAALNWPFPTFYRQVISSLQANAVLSWVGVCGELAVAFLLAAWVFFPARRKQFRIAALILLVGIHGFAAVALNVFFFGISLLTQVTLLTLEPEKQSLGNPKN